MVEPQIRAGLGLHLVKCQSLILASLKKGIFSSYASLCFLPLLPPDVTMHLLCPIAGNRNMTSENILLGAKFGEFGAVAGVFLYTLLTHFSCKVGHKKAFRLDKCNLLSALGATPTPER